MARPLQKYTILSIIRVEIVFIKEEVGAAKLPCHPKKSVKVRVFNEVIKFTSQTFNLCSPLPAFSTYGNCKIVCCLETLQKPQKTLESVKSFTRL